MEYGIWTARDLSRLFQSIASTASDLPGLAVPAGRAAAAHLKGRLAALQALAQALGVAAPHLPGEAPLPARTRRGAAPPPPPADTTWFAEDLTQMLQSIARTANDLAAMARLEGDWKLIDSYLQGFHGALRSVAQALDLPEPSEAALHPPPKRSLWDYLLPFSLSLPAGRSRSS